MRKHELSFFWYYEHHMVPLGKYHGLTLHLLCYLCLKFYVLISSFLFADCTWNTLVNLFENFARTIWCSNNQLLPFVRGFPVQNSGCSWQSVELYGQLLVVAQPHGPADGGRSLSVVLVLQSPQDFFSWDAGPLGVENRGVAARHDGGNVLPVAGQQSLPEVQVPWPSLHPDGVGSHSRLVKSLLSWKSASKMSVPPTTHLKSSTILPLSLTIAKSSAM